MLIGFRRVLDKSPKCKVPAEGEKNETVTERISTKRPYHCSSDPPSQTVTNAHSFVDQNISGLVRILGDRTFFHESIGAELTSVTAEVPAPMIAFEPCHGEHMSCWHRRTLQILFDYDHNFKIAKSSIIDEFSSFLCLYFFFLWSFIVFNHF